MERTVIFLIALLLGGCQTPYQPQLTTPPVVAADPSTPIDKHILAIHEALVRAQATAEQASNAPSTAQIKQLVDLVYAEIWGIPSGLIEQPGGANTLGWKSRWQASFANFDPAYADRYGSIPPEITDPSQLGIAGQGRHIRRVLSSSELPRYDEPMGQYMIGLNNVIGWHRLDDGVTKAERQPRIDLTYLWDADKSFWLGTADTGWLFEVHAQALNILKSKYSDAAQAQGHARDLVTLINKCLTGEDANGNGNIELTIGEAGYGQALEQAYKGGLL